MPTDWYPVRLADRVPWHANFALQAAASGTSHGLIAAQVTQIGVDSTLVAQLVNYAETVASFAQSVTEFKNIMLEGAIGTPAPSIPTVPAALTLAVGTLPSVEARTRQYAALIRASVGYTDAIGEQYGLIAIPGGGATTPSLVAAALSGAQVRLAISKAGYSVLAIDSRRGGGAWEQIGISMTAEYIDARALLVAGQPEVREYRAQGMENNARVGAMSPVVSAVAVP